MSVFNSTKKFIANHYGKIAIVVGVGAVVYAWKTGRLSQAGDLAQTAISNLTPAIAGAVENSTAVVTTVAQAAADVAPAVVEAVAAVVETAVQ